MVEHQMHLKLNSIPLICEKFDPDKPPSLTIASMRPVDEVVTRLGKVAGIDNFNGKLTEFTIEHPNLRETVSASGSRSFNRQRQLVCCLSMALFNLPHGTLQEISAYINQTKQKLYTTESNGALYQFVQRYLSQSQLFSSEYLGDEYKSGEIINGIRHEDLQRSSFDDELFDIILSSEVFEHIPDAPRAEQEVVRILKKNGVYCFTVPLIPYADVDVINATRNADGSITHYTTPEFHGDPVRPTQGSLVYRIFSHRGIRQRFEQLNCEVTAYHLYSRLLGIIGENALVYVVKKLA